MNNQDILIKLSSLIEKLEENNFYKEADILHNEFLKVAQEETNNVSDVAMKAGIGLGVGKAIGDAFKSIGKGFVSKPADMFKRGLVGMFANKSIDFLVDSMEDSQGPFVLFENHMPDVRKIVSKIKNLVTDSELDGALDNLLNNLEDIQSELKGAKQVVASTYNIKFKTTYNNKTTRLAIRGEITSEAPKYLRDLIQGGTVGGITGGLFGGVGALPGAILGALGQVGSRAAEDILYASISNSGKAYFQAKDLNDKVTRLANSLEEIDPNKTNSLKSQAEKILEIAEDINIKNPNKSPIEKYIRHMEKKVEKVTKPISDVVKGTGSLVEKGKSVVKENIPNNIDISPSTQSTYFIR